MSHAIDIRSATLDDLPYLLKFEQAIISTEPPFDETLVPGTFHYYDLAERIRDPDAEVVVAECDGVLVGGGSAIIKKGDSYNIFDRYAFLGFMFVEPDYRGKGINRLIIDKLVEWSKTSGTGSQHTAKPAGSHPSRLPSPSDRPCSVTGLYR